MGTKATRDVADDSPSPDVPGGDWIGWMVATHEARYPYPRGPFVSTECISDGDPEIQCPDVAALAVEIIEPVLVTHRELFDNSAIRPLLVDFSVGRKRGVLCRFLVGVMEQHGEGVHYEAARLGIATLHYMETRQRGSTNAPRDPEPPAETPEPLVVFDRSVCRHEGKDWLVMRWLTFPWEPPIRRYDPEHVEGLSGPDLPLTTDAAAEYAWEAGGTDAVTDVLDRLLEGAFYVEKTDRPFVMVVRRAIGTLRDELLAGCSEGGVDHLTGDQGRETNPPKTGWFPRALGVLAEHPDWSVREIARAVKRHHTALYRNEVFMGVWKAVRGGDASAIRSGHRDVESGVESYQDPTWVNEVDERLDADA